MHLKNALILNSGSISDFEFSPEFDPSGNPKPLILVGANGSGKTNVLSAIADGLSEIAAQQFSDILPALGAGRAYYRLLGGGTIRTGQPFELYALKFVHDDINFLFRAKTGHLAPADMTQRMAEYAGVANWPVDKADKSVLGDVSQIEKIFRSGVYAFFPANRGEVPYWLNTSRGDEDAQAAFTPRMVNLLRKPIVIQSSLSELKPWIVDVILDQSVDIGQVISATSMDDLRKRVAPLVPNMFALQLLNAIVQIVLREPQARVVRVGRRAASQKIQVFGPNNEVMLPSLEAFSSGQASLFSIFASIMRYGDAEGFRPADQIQGVAIIDEVDAHLHAELQHDVLPSLIKLFPKVQFIVASHAPLFLLGMKKAFGDGGFTLLNVPSGEKLDPERFGEFERSFKIYEETKAFEKKISELSSAKAKPYVLCEGETDPAYLRTAAEVLGMSELVAGVEFDWVGTNSNVGAQGGGKAKLEAAFKFLKNNPKFVSSRTLFLFDYDTGRTSEDSGKLFVRRMPVNTENKVCISGVENLLPESVFEEKFYDVKEYRTADITTKKTLKKTALCDEVCSRKTLGDFEKFRELLTEMRGLLLDA